MKVSGFEMGFPKRRQGWRAFRCKSDPEVIRRLEYLSAVVNATERSRLTCLSEESCSSTYLTYPPTLMVDVFHSRIGPHKDNKLDITHNTPYFQPPSIWAMGHPSQGKARQDMPGLEDRAT